MIMLREYGVAPASPLPPPTLAESSSLCVSSPSLLFVQSSLRLHSPHLRVFSYPFHSPLYWFVVDTHKHACPYIHIAQSGENADGVMLANGVRLLLEHISVPVDGARQFDIAAESSIMNELAPLLSQFFPSHEPQSRVPHTVFYMAPEQMENTLKVDFSLPYGYSFSELSCNEAEDVKETITDNETVEAISEQIRELPSSCIRHCSSPSVVSHQLTSPRGDMVHLHTSPDHRRQGLGSATELRLAQIIIRQHGTPLKAVPNHLGSILLSSEESPFWTMWTKNTFPVQFIVQRWERA